MNIRITATSEICKYLSESDTVLGTIIEKYGVIDYALQTDCFETLLSNIVGQQLSGKVADVIWARFERLFDGSITPETTVALDDEKMRGVGISYKKISYIKNLAQAVIDGKIAFDKIFEADDTEIIKQLSSIKGIGAWTAEMFLIFSLGREDVFSKGDGGLARAIDNLYGDGKAFTPKGRAAIAERWKPYRSIASLYLWRSLDNG